MLSYKKTRLGDIMLRPAALPAAALLCSLTVFSACKSTAGGSDTKADFTDKKPERDETWTQARIVSFNQYAEDLLNYSGNERKSYNEAALQLKNSFEKAGIANYDPLSSYTIALGHYGECFGEESGDYGIWWNSHRDEIKKQIEEVAFFVRDYHYLMFGRSRGAFSFREVIICPEAKTGTKMLLDGYKLYIGIPYARGHYRPIPNTGTGTLTLRGLWEDGYPLGLGQTGKGISGKVKALFSKEEKAKLSVKALWTLFNPLAPARQGLRRLLHEHRDTVLSGLKKIKTSSDSTTAARKELPGIAYPDDRVPADADLSGEPDDVVQKLIANWTCQLTSPAPVSDVENDAMAMVQDNIKRTQVRNDVEAGLVAVVNHHDVGVLLAIGTGTYNKHLDASVIQEFKVESRVRAGLVAVSTSDNISIDVRFLASSGKALRAGTFMTALKDARAGMSSCAG